MEKKNCLGLYVFLGLLSVAIAIPIAVNSFVNSSRTVSVRGLCERQVQADRAIWPIVFKEGGNSLTVLAAEVQKKNDVIRKWLMEAGFSEDEISVSSPKVEDLRTGYYEKRPYDYAMTSVITVCSGKVMEVVKLQQRQMELLSGGIPIGSGNSWEYSVTYDFTDLNSIKPAMIEEATLNARSAADKFAHDSGQKVGKIRSAAQGQFTISDRDANTPYIKTVRVVTSVVYQLR